MPGFIPREKLTAYQRWELEAFDEDEQATEEPTEKAAAQAAETLPQEESREAAGHEQSSVALLTAADIERIHNEAHEQGYAEGHTEGLAQGHAEGYSTGQAEGHSAGYEAGHEEGHSAGYAEGMVEAQEITARITEILEGLGQAVEGIEQHVADQLLATAVEIASQVLRRSLKIKPELILPVVREAVAALQIDSGCPALRAHPDDAALIQAQMGDALAHGNWRIIEDPSLTRGGCRVELGDSEVDATLETRWKRVIETIGAKRDWLSDDKS
jgi:flagellar assembly protein FliH